MVSFQRMKDDPELAQKKNQAKTLPCVLLLGFSALVFLLGVFAGSWSTGLAPCTGCSHSINIRSNQSCPALQGEFLITTIQEGNSFEGLSVELQCSKDYTPYPLSVKCEKRRHYDGSTWLQWSSFPVCLPSGDQLQRISYARSVYCTGAPSYTQCKLHCSNNYVAVEESSYSCSSLPCPAWKPDNKHCYVCGDNCDQFHALHHPKPGDLLRTMTCDHHCDKIVVTSDKEAAVWQSKRIGMFRFVGEHNSRPAYRNQASKEYLYYTTTGAEWLIGPDFTKQKAGIIYMQK